MFFNVHLHDLVLLFISHLILLKKALLAIYSCRNKVSDSNSDAMLLEVAFGFFFKDRTSSALRLASADRLMPEDVSVASTVMLSAPYVTSSSASKRSNLSGTLMEDMMDKGVVLGLSPIISASS